MGRWALCSVVVAAALAAAGAGGAADRGLDVTLRPVPAAGARITAAELDRSVAIMRARLARLGARGTVTRRSSAVVLRLDGNASSARNEAALVGERGAIDFYDLETSLLPPSIDAARQAVPSTDVTTLRRRPGAGNGVIVSCVAGAALVCPGANGGVVPAPRTTYYYLLEHRPVLEGDDLVRSATRPDTDPATGTPLVSIRFTRRGDTLFRAVTRAEAQRGRATGTPQHFAIVVDGRLRSFPQIDYRAYPNGIDPTARGAEITGLPTVAATKSLAAILQTAELPVSFVVVR